MAWQTTEPPEDEQIEYRRDGGAQVFEGKVHKTPVAEGEILNATRLYIADEEDGELFAVTSWRRVDPADA